MLLHILYGSESGTAEDVAYRIYRQACTAFSCAFICMDDYDMSALPTAELVIFVVSTSGDGEVPANMRTFWKFLLRKSLASDSLQLLRFATFGLGDASYEKFNAASRKLTSRLKQLGASEIVSIGLGDDQAKFGYLSAFEPWLEDLWNSLYAITSIRVLETPKRVEKCYSVNLFASSKEEDRVENITYPLPDSTVALTADVCKGVMLENRRITAPSWNQDVRHIRIELDRTTGPCPPYRAGDVAYIYPRNSVKDMERMLAIISSSVLVQDSTWITVVALSSSIRRRQLGSVSCPIRTLLQDCLDICGIPQRSFFEILAEFSSSQEDREKLIEIASREGTDLYFDYCVREKRTYIDILEDFKSVVVGIDVLLEMIPRLQPRQYSIASTSLTTPTEMHLCVGLVAYKTRFKRKKVGVCSDYLSGLAIGDLIMYSIRRGSVVLPADKPVILIGPGTGVAPMRAAIYERLASSQESTFSFSTASTSAVLFFGCRRRDSDYLYEDEWAELGLLTSLSKYFPSIDDHLTRPVPPLSSPSPPVAVIPAFSRDSDEVEYVTHKISQHGELVWSLMKQVWML